MLLVVTKEITMNNIDAKKLWATFKHPKSASEFIKAKRSLADLWVERAGSYPAKSIYVDPGMDKYVFDVEGYTKQPVYSWGHNEHSSGTRLNITDADVLRVGIAWKSKNPYNLNIFGCLDKDPEFSTPRDGSWFLHNKELCGIKTQSLDGSDPEWYRAEVIDIDVNKLRNNNPSDDRNHIHLGFSVDNNQDADTPVSKEDLSAYFFVQCFPKEERVISRRDTDFKISKYLLEKSNLLLDLGTISSLSMLAASVDLDNSEVIVHNQPLPNKPATEFGMGDIEDILKQSNDQLSILKMFKVVIPLHNVTQNPQFADVLITDLNTPFDPNKKMLNPSSDMAEIMELLMV